MLESKYRDYLQHELNYSEHTLIAYTKDIEDFQIFLSSKALKDATKNDVKDFLAFHVKIGLEKRSINRKLSALKSYFHFLYITNTIQEIPTQGIKSLRFNRKAQIPMNENEIKKLFDAIHFEDDFTGIRDKAILLTMYHTGMRRAELIGIKVADVDFERLQLKIFGKGRKERLLPMNQELVNTLQNYMKVVREELIEQGEFLFVTQKGRKLYPELVNRITNHYLGLVTEKQKKSPHIMRHTFATHLLNNGANISVIKELLGHESLASTTHYMHNDINQLKKVFNLAHPRESK